MTGDPTLDFLLRGVARLSHGQLDVVPDPPDSFPDHDHMTELAARHGLAGWLERWLPSDHPAIPAIGSIAGLAAIRSMEASAALIELCAALEDAGVRYLQIKGPSAAIRFHGDVRKRPFMDLDIFVPPENLWDSASVAEALGFHLDERLRQEHLPHLDHIHLSHIRGPIRVEIHRRLADFPGLDGPFDGFWERRDHFKLSGIDIPCLGGADTLYHSSIHGTSHAFSSLKWLADLALMSRNLDVAEEALHLGALARMKPAFLCGYALLESMGGAVPAPIQAQLKVRSRRLSRLVGRSRSARPFGESGLWVHRVWMLHPVERLRALADATFTPGSRDWDVAPWLPPRTPLVFQAIRLIRLTFKVGRLSIRRLMGLAAPTRTPVL